MLDAARNTLSSTALVLLLGYGGIVGWLWLNQDAILFPVGTAGGPLVEPDGRLGLHPVRVETTTSDGVRLVGWMAADPAPGDSALWLLAFHGNGGNVSSAGRPEHYRALRALGLNLLTFDYRGYGESEGWPSEAGLYRDADAAYDYLRRVLGVPPERIVLYGHSLGSAVAVDLASRHPAAGLVLEGSFTSVPDVGQRVYPFLPVRLLARNRFDSGEKIARVAIPKLFLHARRDDVIPFRLGQRLYRMAPGPKRFVELRGGHNDAYDVDSAAYFGAIREFIAGLRP